MTLFTNSGVCEYETLTHTQGDDNTFVVLVRQSIPDQPYLYVPYTLEWYLSEAQARTLYEQIGAKFNEIRLVEIAAAMEAK